MTEEHLSALLGAAEAKKDGEGWMRPPEGRNITLYVSSNGASMTVGKVEALRVAGQLLRARTVRGEEFVLALEDVFAGAVDAPATAGRKAGFV
jgi:hypothetical protein